MAPETRDSTHCAEHGEVAAGVRARSSRSWFRRPSQILKELQQGAVKFARHDGEIKAVEQSGVLTRRLVFGIIAVLLSGAGIALATILG